MRWAWLFMMPRKRSRAGGSLRAGPSRVSMKPSSEARGVRNSWLALATKSTRIASSRRAEVRSRRNRTTFGWPPAGPSGIGRAPTWTSKARSVGTRVA